jgi:hypothetical protein
VPNRIAVRIGIDGSVTRIAENLMKRTRSIVTLAAVTKLAVPATVGHAKEDSIDKAKADAFDVRMFAAPPGNKAYACFVRRYDPDHLVRHPKQKSVR